MSQPGTDGGGLVAPDGAIDDEGGRRRRFFTGVVAAMLVVGAGGVGFGIGRAVSDDEGGVATTETSLSDPVVVTTAPEPMEPSSTDEPAARTTEPPTTSPPDSVPTDVSASELDAADVSAAPGYWGGGEMETVYVRVLDDGSRLRLQRGQTWVEDWGDSWQPAPFCYPTAEARVTIDGPEIVDVTGAGWYEEIYGDIAVSPMEFGWADGRPMRLLQVQGRPGVTDVSVTWPDGTGERTALVDGVAVLASPGRNAWEGFVVEYTDGDGTHRLDDAAIDPWGDPEYRAACQEPPPALPEPGEQPADPTGAEAAIVERFALLWDTSIDPSDKPGILDDWTGVADAIDEVGSGAFGDAAATAAHTIDEIVFTSATEAWFRYSLTTDITDFYDRYGTARLVDGVWQFPRDLICQDLSLGGGVCVPDHDPIYPPSWYERYGEPVTECWIDADGTEVCEEYFPAG